MAANEKIRAVPGFEPGTSPTQTENHTSRPNGRRKKSDSLLRGPCWGYEVRASSVKRLVKRKMTAVGFEPTRIAPPELESGALDRSAKLSLAHARTPGQGEMKKKGTRMRNTTTPRGFEPLRAEPNGFLVHLLNRSDTVSVENRTCCSNTNCCGCGTCAQNLAPTGKPLRDRELNPGHPRDRRIY